MIRSIMLLAVKVGAAAAAACGSSTFSRDLGDTHCPNLAPRDATSAGKCMEACCAAGETCQTWQWCEAGQPCATGFWAQPGALARGHDLDGWPQNTTIDVAEKACSANVSCTGLTYHSPELHPDHSTILKIYLKMVGSGPAGDSTWSRHLKAHAGCFIGRLDSSCANGTRGWMARALPPRPHGPCDVLAAAHTPCVAAHSVVRALYANYTGALYRVLRDKDHASLDIMAGLNSGVANTAAQDEFCKDTACYTLRIYDQSPGRNHLDTSPAGGACHYPLAPVNATRERVSVGGHPAYAAYFEGSMGYRNDVTRGVATGEQAQTMIMVTRGDHVNGGCVRDWRSNSVP